MFKKTYLLGLALSINLFATEISVSDAVKDAKLEELALTYNTTKIEKALGEFEYKDYSSTELQELAMLVDLGFIEKKDIKEGMEEELAFMQGTFSEEAKNYIGYVSDKSIYKDVLDVWNTSSFYTQEELVSDLRTGLMEEVFTGYNIKKKEDNSNFDKELEMTYGHSDITHAIQLIALLKTEDIEAKVQLEPKTSSFTYLKEWGEPRNTENYKVVKNDGDKWVAYAKEYDLSFEFESMEDKDRFKEVVTKYAKKDTADEKGLITASWWQPLYYSEVEASGHKLLINNILEKDGYEVHIFSLENKSKAIVDRLGIEKTRNIYVNQAFYNYMFGDYK